MSLGARIRQTRTQKGITLQDLSERSGLSKGFICQLENDKATPSLQALEKIASGLSIPIAFLFLTADDRIHVVRESERQAYRVGDEGLLVKMLSDTRRNLKMMVMELPPGAGTGGEHHVHEGEECFLILEGLVRFTQAAESIELKSGDSLHWNGYVPHRMENAGTTSARVICITSGTVEDMLECNECNEYLIGDADNGEK